PERAQVDELAPAEHESAEDDEGERRDVGRGADRPTEAVGDRASDDAAAPAGVEDRGEEESEREEEEPRELGMLVPAGPPRALLPDPCGRPGTQPRASFLATPSHAASFAASNRTPLAQAGDVVEEELDETLRVDADGHVRIRLSLGPAPHVDDGSAAAELGLAVDL